MRAADRELLDLAAKAAGVGPLDHDYAEREGHGFDMGPRLPMPQGVLMAAMWTYWDPLNDDGDALRLAGKLGFAVEIDTIDDVTRVRECDCDLLVQHMHFDGDAYAATRRAIVRAAAEIGKAMP